MAKVTFSPLVTSINGSIGNLTFKQGVTNTLLMTKPSGSKSYSRLRSQMLEDWRYCLAVASDANIDDISFASIFCQLFPKYQTYPSNLLKSAAYHLSRVYFNTLLTDDFLSSPGVFALEPADAYIASVYLSGGSLYCELNRSIDGEFANVVPYVSRRYSKAKPYLSAATSFMAKDSFDGQTFNITASYMDRYGLLPEVGNYICVTSTFFNYESGHILPDVTTWFEITEV